MSLTRSSQRSQPPSKLFVRQVVLIQVDVITGAADNDEQVEVKYFLDHWTEIRSSDAMRNVWHQIRLGRHPGFEEGLCKTTLFQFIKLITTYSLACHSDSP